MRTSGHLALALGLLVVLVVLLAYQTRVLYSHFAAVFALLRGDAAKARKYLEVTRRSPTHRLLRSSAKSSDYNLALCQHLAGDQEGALQAARALPYMRESRARRRAIDLLIASCLFELGRELPEAQSLVESAMETRRTPELVWFYALILKAQDDPRAKERFEEACRIVPTEPRGRSWLARFLRSDESVRRSRALARGHYLVLDGRRDEARPFLLDAFASPPGIVRERAKKLLGDDAPRDPDEDRSSLAPTATDATS